MSGSLANGLSLQGVRNEELDERDVKHGETGWGSEQQQGARTLAQGDGWHIHARKTPLVCGRVQGSQGGVLDPDGHVGIRSLDAHQSLEGGVQKAWLSATVVTLVVCTLVGGSQGSSWSQVGHTLVWAFAGLGHTPETHHLPAGGQWLAS